MGAKNPRVDAYIEKAAPFAQPILTHVRKVVHAACPDVEETIKWGFPHFERQGIVCSVAAFKAHCAFGFWKGSRLDIPKDGEIRGAAMGEFGRIESKADLPSDKALTSLVRRAVELNEKGVKRDPLKTKRPKRPLVIPKELSAALKKKKGALANFESMSPTERRDYAEWISEAKQAATKERRLASAVEWISDGKSRNWKYEKKK